ncbi:MAG: TIGR03905 family TSCPD domain-containing protein [Ruminococcus sp.]|nr:TIGR03905 family TSCPD domain-containing protein [Ruminococcus sp.]
MKYEYTPVNVCSRKIYIDINDDGTIENIEFIGGCNGNLKGIGQLVKGMKAEDVIERLEGITCGMKNTSCPAQLAEALKEIL